ncbi:hypothetical protein ACIA8O_17585 [Kitasatospora sp. NPDC051853]|uniref:hypothetical protein n=1 Tax=Kitasatospora sp. NPDC051853 TaxID=3364058 RepID=UPI0037A74FE8
MMIGMTMIDGAEPRAHHYGYAHRVLAGLARDLGVKMLDREPAPGFTGGLTAIWQGYGEQLPESERLSADGLSADLVQRDGYRALLVILPPAVAPSEAHLVAVVQSAEAEQCRYLTLEHGVSPIDRQTYTVLGEWTADGQHINLGPGPAAEPDAFLAAVERVLEQSVPAHAAARTGTPEIGKPRARGLRGLFGR